MKIDTNNHSHNKEKHMRTPTYLRTAIVTLAVALILPVSGFSQADPPGPPAGFGGRMKMFQELKKKLDITSDQEKQIKSIRQNGMREQIKLRADLQILRLDARQIAESEKPDRVALEKKLREIGELQVKQKLMMFDQMTEMQKILTPEQLKKWKEIRPEMGPGRMGRMEQRGQMRHQRGCDR